MIKKKLYIHIYIYIYIYIKIIQILKYPKVIKINFKSEFGGQGYFEI